MILVTVGMHSQPFDRLIVAADGMAACLDEPVVIQRGVSRYAPTHCAFYDFVTQREMEEQLRKARVVISQSGAGSILACLRADAVLVLAPRLQRHGESIDDHQVELAEALDRRGRAVMAMDLSPGALLDAVQRVVDLEDDVEPDRRLQRVLGDWLSRSRSSQRHAGRRGVAGR